eukprot:scaffold22203_cov64-Phaeocystis_antarctica.AAC.2
MRLPPPAAPPAAPPPTGLNARPKMAPCATSEQRLLASSVPRRQSHRPSVCSASAPIEASCSPLGEKASSHTPARCCDESSATVSRPSGCHTQMCGAPAPPAFSTEAREASPAWPLATSTPRGCSAMHLTAASEGHLARWQEAEVAPAVDTAVAVHELQLEPAAARLAAREPLGPRRRAALDERLQQLLGHGLKGFCRLPRLAGSRDQPLRFRCCGAALLVVLHLRI